MQRYLDVLLVEPNKKPKTMKIKNNIKEKRKLVNGNIKYKYLQDCDDVVLICNDESKNKDLPINRYIDNDVILGNFIIVGDNFEFGEDRSLTSEQIKKYKDKFNNKDFFKNNDNYEEEICI